MSPSILEVSVVIPAHNPNPVRLGRVLAALRAQTLPSAAWEVVVVDNASTPAFQADSLGFSMGPHLRVVREDQLGLSHARARGFSESAAPIVVLVDDDNVLAPDYLATAIDFLKANPGIGLVGGKVLPEFETEPSDDLKEFMSLLALRDLGEDVLIAPGFQEGVRMEYPLFAPMGAGMVLTRTSIDAWLVHFRLAANRLTDRKGSSLASSGDNDIVLAAMAAGHGVAYLPPLMLTHLIPAQRLEAEYLARLNFGIQRSWMQVLTLHGVCPWPPLSPLGARLRQLRAWFRLKPWRTVANRVRFAGVCGHFAGRVSSS